MKKTGTERTAATVTDANTPSAHERNVQFRSTIVRSDSPKYILARGRNVNGRDIIIHAQRNICCIVAVNFSSDILFKTVCRDLRVSVYYPTLARSAYVPR